ncbi:hypothetical protein E2320_008225 [Naja naja]|nr:hypothetical protein E2320_008225 [Naja naja]
MAELICSGGHILSSLFLASCCGFGAAAAQSIVGTAFTSEPISHQMSSAAAKASNSRADNLPCMLNI